MSVAFLIAAALVAGTSDAEPKIVVHGYGETKLIPDVAHITYEVRGEGKTSDEAVAAMVATVASVENGLLSIDPAVEPKSGRFTVKSVPGPNCKEDRSRDDLTLSTGPCGIAGYIAQQSFNAVTQKVSDAGTMVGLAGRNGAKDPEVRTFDLRDRKGAKDKAIAQALADARAKAEVIAQASGTTVGRMIAASLDGARDDGETIVVSGSRVQRPALEAPAPITVKVAPRLIETTARVTVTYTLR